MGGDGSGRRQDPTNRVVGNLIAFNNVPQATDGQVYLPNFMGLQPVKKSDAPVGGGSASWGGITGTLSDQTDLQNALDLKLDVALSGGFTLQNYSTALSGAHAVTSGATVTHIGASTAHGTTSTIVGKDDTQTFTNKTYNLTNNTLSGTMSQFDTALSDGNFSYDGHTHAVYASGAITAVITSGSALASGAYVDVLVPFNCTLNTVTALADASGTAYVNIWKDTYTNYPPTIADTLFSGAVVINAATKAQDTTLTSWNKTITQGDIIRFITSGAATTIKQISVILNYTR